MTKFVVMLSVITPVRQILSELNARASPEQDNFSLHPGSTQGRLRRREYALKRLVRMSRETWLRDALIVLREFAKSEGLQESDDALRIALIRVCREQGVPTRLPRSDLRAGLRPQKPTEIEHPNRSRLLRTQ